MTQKAIFLKGMFEENERSGRVESVVAENKSRTLYETVAEFFPASSEKTTELSICSLMGPYILLSEPKQSA